MEYMTDWQFFGCLICFWGVLFGTLAYGIVLVFKLWARHFHHKPLSSVNQKIKLFGWILLVSFLIFYTLWAFGIFVPF